jgi:hypothetical protein
MQNYWMNSKMVWQFKETSHIAQNICRLDNFLPRDEWNKVTSIQKEAVIEKLLNEQQNGVDGSRKHLTQPRSQVYMHDLFVNLDDLIV